MWFVLLGIALLTVVFAGLYFRHRTLAALAVVGVSPRGRKIAGIVIPLLLFAVPVLTFMVVLGGVALGRESFVLAPTGVAQWLIIFPFWWAVLVTLQSVPFYLIVDLASWLARRRSNTIRTRSLVSLAVLAGFAIYTPARIAIEHDDLEIRRHQVGPVAADPFRIAFFADLQLDENTDVERAAEVIAILNKSNPDLALVGGDWINTGPEHIADAGEVAATIRAKHGVFSVRGDHEHFAYRDAERSVNEVTRTLAAAGVEMIDNEVRSFEHRGRRVALIYLTYNYIVRTETVEISKLIESAASADYTILITHQLDSNLAALIKDRVDLALVAHTHGGQVNPFVLFRHISLARVETPYVSGRYQLGRTTIIVTSGIGFSIAPLRYASPASVEIIDVQPARESAR